MSPSSNRERSLIHIKEPSAWFVHYIKSSTAMGHYDINLIAEDLLIPIFQEVYDYEDLKNLNLAQGNFPGIDLGDKTKGVAIQITATASSSKISNTLKKYTEHNQDRPYKKLIVYIITEKQATYSGQGWPELAAAAGLEFDKDKDIRDYSDLMEAISYLPLEKIQRVEAIYQENFEKHNPNSSTADPQTKTTVMGDQINIEGDAHIGQIGNNIHIEGGDYVAGNKITKTGES